MDLSSFLERQRLRDEDPVASPPKEEEEAVDHSLAHLVGTQPAKATNKGRIQQIEWDEDLERMSREKAAADAARGKIW